MSANFVSKDCIDLLVTAALTWGDFLSPGTYSFRRAATRRSVKSDWNTASELGEMLWRYNYDVTEGWIDPPEVAWHGYEFERYPGEPDPLVVLKTISYYGYHTGDNPEEYDLSLQKGFMDELRDDAVRRLQGYDDAPWGIEDRNAFSR